MLSPASRVLIFATLTLAVVATGLAAGGQPLSLAEVSAPDVNCVFAPDCTLTVEHDRRTDFTVPAANGDGSIQSRTVVAEAGSPAAGLRLYLYAVDLSPVGAFTVPGCVDEVRIDFGETVRLDFDGDGDVEDAFVLTGGALGTIAPISAQRLGREVILRFPAICPGSRPGAGQRSFFVGLVSPLAPRAKEAVIGFNRFDDTTAEIWAPQTPRTPPAEPWCRVHVLPGTGGTEVPPIPGWAPICHCLRPSGRQEMRCGLFHPDLVAVWEVPVPVPPGPFAIDWTLLATGGAGGRLTVRPPQGFEVWKIPEPLAELPGGDQGALVTGSTWLAPVDGQIGESKMEVEIEVPKGQRPAHRLAIAFQLSGKQGG